MKILWWKCYFLVLSKTHLDNTLKIIIPETCDLKINIRFFFFLVRNLSSGQDDAAQIQIASKDGSLKNSREITWEEASPNPSIVGICILRARRSVASDGFTEHWVSDPFDKIPVRGPSWGWWPYEYVAAEESKGYMVCGKEARDWSIWNCKGRWFEAKPYKRT